MRTPRENEALMSMSIGFIFMATRQDRTVPQARALIEEALALGVANIGFKDIGLPRAALKELARAIEAGGAQVFFEVVSLDRDRELASAAAAADFGVDWLLGGVRAGEVAPIASREGILYAPFPGAVVGHPSALLGSIEEIEASARALSAIEGVAGLDLLAYRRSGDVAALMRAVVAAVDKPVIVAGSIHDADRIAAVAESGAAGFTVGSAAIEGAFAPACDFAAQIRAIQRAVAEQGDPRR
jgi:thiamine monophosphate synthase